MLTHCIFNSKKKRSIKNLNTIFDSIMCMDMCVCRLGENLILDTLQAALQHSHSNTFQPQKKAWQ